jgi:hypothetical protein
MTGIVKLVFGEAERRHPCIPRGRICRYAALFVVQDLEEEVGTFADELDMLDDQRFVVASWSDEGESSYDTESDEGLVLGLLQEVRDNGPRELEYAMQGDPDMCNRIQLCISYAKAQGNAN